MDLKSRIDLFSDDSRILEQIAAQYSEGSKEHTALRHAGIALWYALSEGHDKFKDYISKFEGDLSPEQRAHLLQMGIDPDSNPE